MSESIYMKTWKKILVTWWRFFWHFCRFLSCLSTAPSRPKAENLSEYSWRCSWSMGEVCVWAYVSKKSYGQKTRGHFRNFFLNSLGSAWNHLETTWNHWETTWNHFESLGNTWNHLETTWNHLEILGITCKPLGITWKPLGITWKYLETTWNHFESLGNTWNHLDR